MTARKPKVRVVAVELDVLLGGKRVGYVKPWHRGGWVGYDPNGFGFGVNEKVKDGRFHPTRAAAVRAVVASWRAKEKP